MIIDVMLHAPDRATFLAGMIARGFMVQVTAPDGSISVRPAADVSVDEIGAIVETPAVMGPDFTVQTPASFVPGYHVNVRCTGAFAEHMTNGLAQVDADGKPLSIFDRTYFLQLLPDFTDWVATPTDGAPKGWQGPDGTRLYDPMWVASPTRVWA